MTGESSGSEGAVIRSRSSHQVRLWIILLLFSVVAAGTIFRHEMWRDEIRAWQAVVDADSPSELADDVRSEGHPGLWYALLFLLSRVTSDPVAMQLLHLALGIAVAATVLFLSPFPWIWRGLIVFGYFPLYEYCVVSRNYAVGALLLFLFCALYRARERRPVAAAGVLFLLAQASAYSLVLSVALGLMWFAESWMERGGRTGLGNRRTAYAFMLWVSGIVVSLAQLARARSVVYPLTVEKATDTNRVLDVLAAPWRGYVPIPRFRHHFWNSNILDTVAGGDVMQALLGIVLVGVFAWLFSRYLPSLMLFVIGTVGLTAFSFFLYVGHVRHQGHHLLLLIACLWIWRASADVDSEAVDIPRGGKWLVSALLATNVVAGLYAVSRDWGGVFSAGRNVADYIRSEGLANGPIFGWGDVQVTPVAGYLRRPLFYPSLGREAFYIPWDATRVEGVDDTEVIGQAHAMARRTGNDVLVVMGRVGPRRPNRLDGAVKIADFKDSIVRSERFELFLVPAPATNVEVTP